jgi:wyosine [tRNA(Phe)-imidazoG37] synthetase (radical SAM superfamily)
MSFPTITFGPVPSRRLGRSLGVNNITARCCTYSCVYCQVRRKPSKRIHRGEFHPPQDLALAVARRVREIQRREEPLDFISFVPDGEPTLDAQLGREIEQLRFLGVPIAVISNGSLLWREEVRAALAEADWVSLKIDTVSESEWHRINRPHSALRQDDVLEGMLTFAADFKGRLTTETMLLADINDGDESVGATATFLAALQPSVAYLAIPTRPTMEPWVAAAGADAVNRAYQLFSERLPRVELLTGWEGTVFGTSGDVEADLMGITAVHPMSHDAVLSLLARDDADWSVVDNLIERGAMAEIEYRGRKFYVRRFVQAEVRSAK